MENFRTRKEFCAEYGIHRSTLHEWEKYGFPVYAGGKIPEGKAIWWCEQKEAAERLGLTPKQFFSQPREVREKLLQAAMMFPRDVGSHPAKDDIGKLEADAKIIDIGSARRVRDDPSKRPTAAQTH